MSNKANLLTNLSIAVGVLGVVALLLAWVADLRGIVLGFFSDHWYNDAVVLLLVAIWLKLGAIYHRGGQL